MTDRASNIHTHLMSPTKRVDSSATRSGAGSQRSSGDSAPLALVVEDEALVAEFLASILDEMGLRVAKADSVGSALEHAREHTRLNERFAVMFIDLGLPDRSGLELTEELQIMQPGVPIVISTGYRTVLQRDIADGSAVPYYLAKPYNTQAIADVLAQIGLQAHLPPLTSFGALAFRMDGTRRTIEVLQGPRGYYLGTRGADGKSYSRESAESWKTAEDAQRALQDGAWTQRLAD